MISYQSGQFVYVLGFRIPRGLSETHTAALLSRMSGKPWVLDYARLQWKTVRVALEFSCPTVFGFDEPTINH